MHYQFITEELICFIYASVKILQADRRHELHPLHVDLLVHYIRADSREHLRSRADCTPRLRGHTPRGAGRLLCSLRRLRADSRHLVESPARSAAGHHVQSAGRLYGGPNGGHRAAVDAAQCAGPRAGRLLRTRTRHRVSRRRHRLTNARRANALLVQRRALGIRIRHIRGSPLMRCRA